MDPSKYGEPYSGDSKFVASCRLLQSVYRTEIRENIRPYIGRVTDVDLEFIPSDYKELTGDKSAMDAIIRLS